MRKSVLTAVCAFALLTLNASSTEAALIDRGGGLIYDSVLNITWLQDAQYTQTSGFAPYGRLSWSAANSWAGGLQYVDSVRGLVWDDWRLPRTIDAPSSLGYDTTGLSSELAFMYYVNLGYAPNYTHDRFDPAPTSDYYNPFVNLAYRGFWSETAGPNGQAWMLHFHFGSQELNGLNDEQRVWAVRDGDVGAAAIPEPGTLALMGLGLCGAGWIKRRRA